MKNQCECVFCEYRRAVDVKNILDQYCNDPAFLAMIAERIGDVKDFDRLRIGIGAMIHDLVPLAAETIARLTVAEANQAPAGAFLVAKELEAMCKSFISFCSLLRLVDIPNMDEGKKLKDSILTLLEAEPPKGMEYGSSRLQ